MNFEEMCNSLHESGFVAYFKENILGSQYTINYGPSRGKRVFYSAIHALNDYPELYGTKLGDYYQDFIATRQGNLSADQIEQLLYCIEVFDWGQVQSKNIKDALRLYHQGQLTTHLQGALDYFNNQADDVISFESAGSVGHWSAGWTKVYSLICDFTCIYGNPPIFSGAHK